MSMSRDDGEISSNPSLDLNSATFNAGKYVSALIQDKGLDELVAVEEGMIMNVRRLDSEMQQLSKKSSVDSLRVYENYNKFLTATATVQKMQDTFNEMNNGIQGLSSRMDEISQLSASLTDAFSANRERVRELTRANRALKKVQFLIELPDKLGSLIEHQQWREAVEAFMKAKPQLEKCSHVDTLSEICQQCTHLVEQLRTQLHQVLGDAHKSVEAQMEAAQLLLLLGEDEAPLRLEFLEGWRRKLSADSNEEPSPVAEPTLAISGRKEEGERGDILEFVELRGCQVITNLSLALTSWHRVFPTPHPHAAEASSFFEEHVALLVSQLGTRFNSERNGGECALYVRALDKIVGKLSTVQKLAPQLDVDSLLRSLANGAAKHQVLHCRETIGRKVGTALADIKDHLHAKIADGGSAKASLPDMAMKLEQEFVNSLKKCLANLLLFTAVDTNLAASIDPKDFLVPFALLVYREVVIGAMEDLTSLEFFGQEERLPLMPELHAIAGVALHSIHIKHLRYLMTLGREQFNLSESQVSGLRTAGELSQDFKEATSHALWRYASCASRWLLLAEGKEEEQEALTENNREQPISRASNKVQRQTRKLQSLAENLISLLGTMPTEVPTERSVHGRSADALSSGSLSLANASLVEKLWSEPEEGDAVLPLLEFTRQSAMGAVVRIFLGELAEEQCRKEMTMHRLQQLQVDLAYMRSKLLTVFDEQRLNAEVERFMNRAISLCENPKLLDPMTVKRICDAGEMAE